MTVLTKLILPWLQMLDLFASMSLAEAPWLPEPSHQITVTLS